MNPANTPLTLDGKPLFGQISDLASADVWTGARVNPAHPFAFSLNLLFPCVAVLLYLASEPVFAALRRATDLQRDNGAFKLFILVHNLALAGFSLWVAVYTWPIAWRHYHELGFKGLHCDRVVWSDAEHGIATWAVIFYCSKFYEFVDTWVLVLKDSDGKHAPGFLQKARDGEREEWREEWREG